MMLFTDQLQCPSSFPWRFANIVSSQDVVISILFSNEVLESHPNDITQECKIQLSQYFKKTLIDFQLPLAEANSPFFKTVHAELIKIPLGATTTYKEIAEKISSAKKARAVGLACASNKISIVVPCHRVLNATHQLNGYAGGLPTKAWLLEHEKHF
ncbi:methylated-DNA--[protein]-cysteine S-methyltransferase [Pelistega sp. NLN82]|uniref:methylated-DNA--[protein]-cysteine S-methyltransferase n=1 Tax=Pelistega ratti TaxID=2652177 RepID=A0A6L9Y4Y7_9BURK|nr:methylated-DNA--[protein]-cysteine S-methyltransferase [Pelistega ratti]NEN75449.1 methylated-DNA--[protein]-cysteine S-methyltransferase [Pelistega ratti]